MRATRTAAPNASKQLLDLLRGLERKPADNDPDTAVLLEQFSHFRNAGQLGTIPAALLAIYFSLLTECKALRARCAALEARERGLSYRGVHAPGQVYRVNDVVTHAGSMWACRADTSDVPGEGSKAWQLAVKRGRDGKDLRDRHDGAAA